MIVNFLNNNEIHIAKAFGPTYKKPYPQVYHFTSSQYNIDTIEEFFRLIKKYGDRGACLLKGTLLRELHNESRAGSTSADTPTEYVVFDVDRCDLSITNIDTFIQTCLPPYFHNTDYIWQWSNSAGICKTGLAGHLIFMLANPVNTKLLKKAIINYNFLAQPLESQIRLAHNGLTLTWGLDPTCAQNDKLIFIAPPILDGIEDPFPERLELVKKSNRTVQLSLDDINVAEIDTNCARKINELRTTANLPRREGRFKNEGSFEYLKNPERAIFRAPYIDARGFRYGNLNNGDSYAYFHHIENPKYLYNFKGEPVVRLQDIDPEYWRQLKEEQNPTDPTKQYLAFRDQRSDLYYTVIYDKHKNTHDTFTVSNAQKAIDFLRVHGQPVPETLPIWDVCFEPNKEYVIDIKEQKLNLYQKTDLLKNATASKYCPLKFTNLISHVVNNDEEMRDELVNWLAYIIQKRAKTQTAFILHGRPGTGKGVLFTKILQPILGLRHCPMIMLDELDRDFNEWIETSILVVVDEAQIGEDSKRAKKRINKIKNLITEKYCILKKKYAHAVQIENFVNFIFTSNEHDSIWIDKKDRRFKVAPRQEDFLDYSQLDITQLEHELQAITDYLIGYPINEEKVNRVPNNKARDALIRAAQTGIDEFIDILKNGDLEELFKYHDEFINSKNAIFAEKFKTLCDEWGYHKGEEIFISTSDLRVIYGFLFGSEISATRFGRLLAGKGIPIEVQRIDKKPTRVIRVTWKFTTEELCLGLTVNLGDTKNAHIN